MDQGANPSTILHVLIPVPIRLNLIRLFHEFDNRLVLCNVSLLYEKRFGKPLNVSQYGCLNMNQFFYSMKHQFSFHQIKETTYVNCCIDIGSIKLICNTDIYQTEELKLTRVDLSFLENIFFVFEPHDFNCIRAILLKTLEMNSPIKVAQFELDFIALAGYAFNYLKYGFKSTSDFFIVFAELFNFIEPTKSNGNSSYSMKDSLSDMLIILKVQ